MNFRKCKNTYTQCYTVIAGDEFDVVETITGEEESDMYIYSNGICIAKFTIICCRGAFELKAMEWMIENEDDAFLCDLAHDIVWHWNNKYDEMIKLID